MTVPRVPLLTARQFRDDFVTPGQPVIMTRSVDDWPARKRWSPQRLAEDFGNERVKVTVLDEPRGADAAYLLANQRFEHRSLREYVRSMQSDHSKFRYLISEPVPAALLKDLRHPPYFSERLCRMSGQPPRLWMGAARAVTPCHSDPLHNFFVQLWGRKRWTIFHPTRRALLGIPSTLRARNMSPLDFSQSDMNSQSVLSRAAFASFTLEPGEALFLPEEWPHFVESMEASISVNFWFQSWKQALLRAPKFVARKLVRKLQGPA